MLRATLPHPTLIIHLPRSTTITASSTLHADLQSQASCTASHAPVFVPFQCMRFKHWTSPCSHSLLSGCLTSWSRHRPDGQRRRIAGELAAHAARAQARRDEGLPIGPSSSFTSTGQYWRDAERRQDQKNARERCPCQISRSYQLTGTPHGTASILASGRSMTPTRAGIGKISIDNVGPGTGNTPLLSPPA